MGETSRQFEERRQEGNNAILEGAPLPIKRFFALDQDVYEDGALPGATKELIGLCASTVLRCNDCITHHLRQAVREGASREEIVETLAIALVVGGSITIPHLRHAFEHLEGMLAESA